MLDEEEPSSELIGTTVYESATYSCDRICSLLLDESEGKIHAGDAPYELAGSM